MLAQDSQRKNVTEISKDEERPIKRARVESDDEDIYEEDEEAPQASTGVPQASDLYLDTVRPSTNIS